MKLAIKTLVNSGPYPDMTMMLTIVVPAAVLCICNNGIVLLTTASIVVLLEVTCDLVETIADNKIISIPSLLQQQLPFTGSRDRAPCSPSRTAA